MTDPKIPDSMPSEANTGETSPSVGAGPSEAAPQVTTPPAEAGGSVTPPDREAMETADSAMENRRLDQYERGGRDNIDLVKSLFLGMVATAIFYEVFPIPFLEQGRVLALFQNDNWVSPMIVGMTFWSMFLLGFKLLHFRFQNRIWQHFRAPRVSALLGGKIYARDVNNVVRDLRAALQAQRAKRFEDAIIYRRVLRVLYFVRGATKKEGLDSLLDYQGQIDMKRLETGYTVLQVFIWAIPILGFIGTVLGIGFSVNEFAHFIQSAEAGGQFTGQMRAALGGVTGGLAIAFNTTFLALVLVIPVMLLTSFLHKNEEEFLLEIEEYCMEELLPRLHVSPGEEVASEGFDEHLHKVMRLSQTWLSQFEPLVEKLSRQSEMMSHQLTGIQPLIKEFTDRLLPGQPEVARPEKPPGATSHAAQSQPVAPTGNAESQGEDGPPEGRPPVGSGSD